MRTKHLSRLLFYILAVTLPIFSWHSLSSVAKKFKHSNKNGLLDLGAVLSSNMYDVRKASKIAKDYYEEISESNAKKNMKIFSQSIYQRTWNFNVMLAGRTIFFHCLNN